jgi:BASS family bile acid:Na+ symporter
MEPISIQFSPASLTALNICLAIIMFGVALDIKWIHFTELLNQKKAVVVGLVSQFIVLPVITVILIAVLPISTGMAMGMLLVACCPGGNVSNFYTQMARGNVALSVTLTAWSSLAAFLITPLSFLFWASLIPSLSIGVKSFDVDFISIMVNMLSILLLPLVLGMLVTRYLPTLSRKIASPIRLVSMLLLTGFIVVAVLNNQEAFGAYLGNVFWVVLLQNGLVIALAFYFSAAFKNDEAINRTIAIETGIQNSGLALILIFNFFDGNAAMAVVAAWWGVWHLISGFAFATFMRRRSPTSVIQS